MLEVDIRARGVDVAFSAAPGFTVLFGPSGAGKTTTLMAIAGLVTPIEGSITLHGTSLIAMPPHRRRIGLVFQSLALFPHLSAAENVAYGARATGREKQEQAMAWLRRLQVEHLAARRPDTFSGGEGQRVALARVLAAEPRALLLDEPFSALDDALRVSLRDDLRTIVDERKLPVVFVTHDRGEAHALAQHVVLMSEGKVIARGDVDLISS
jgi:molybdate transport system ATP-binding protein